MKFRSVIEHAADLADNHPGVKAAIHQQLSEIGGLRTVIEHPFQWLHDNDIGERVLEWADNHPKAAAAIREHIVELVDEVKDLLPWCHEDTLDFEYSSVEVSEVILTGVRSDSLFGDDVVVTASSVLANGGGATGAALYQGSLQDLASASSSDWHVLTPEFDGQTVTTSTFYGPNTAIFDPDIGAGNVRAVGSYKYAEDTASPNSNHGMIYEGPVDGVGGTWTQIDATPLVAPGDTLLNTIAHSTMGDLVVGNYDTSLATGHAFIYNMEEDEWYDLNPPGALSLTAYGIWQNGGSDSTSYTIAGGYSDLNRLGLDAGYVLDYDSETNTVTSFTTFQYDNQPIDSLISHFDGITGTDDGYHLTGDFVTADGTTSGFFAEIERKQDGSFSEARWSEITFPGDDVSVTSGNTVVDDTVLGIYVENGEPNSYVASASDPCNCWDFWG